MTVGLAGEAHRARAERGSRRSTPEPHVSFAYLGPVEWDNMGDITYGLWVHLAPGNDWQFDDIKAPGAVVLALDDGAAAADALEQPPARARGPYRPVASWGQTAYFELDLDTAQTHGRRAASIELDFKAAGTRRALRRGAATRMRL